MLVRRPHTCNGMRADGFDGAAGRAVGRNGTDPSAPVWGCGAGRLCLAETVNVVVRAGPFNRHDVVVISSLTKPQATISTLILVLVEPW